MTNTTPPISMDNLQKEHSTKDMAALADAFNSDMKDPVQKISPLENKPFVSPDTEIVNTKPFVSAGKRVHNEITYRGVDWVLNSTIGVAMTYWTARTPSGNKYFQQPVKNFFKGILTPVFKSESARDLGAYWGSMFTSIIVGGTAIIPPLTYLENKDRKKHFVKAIDNTIYGKERVENDPKFAECYDAIDTEPHKNFKTGMAARLIVLAPMIAVTLNHNANKLMVKHLYNPIAKGSKILAEGMGIRPRYLMERGVVELAEGDLNAKPRFLSDWDFIHRTIGFDLGLTFIYSFAHEAAYKGLAAMGFKKTQEEEDTLAKPSVAPSLSKENMYASAHKHMAMHAPKPNKHSQRVTPPTALHQEAVSASEQEAVVSL